MGILLAVCIYPLNMACSPRSRAQKIHNAFFDGELPGPLQTIGHDKHMPRFSTCSMALLHLLCSRSRGRFDVPNHPGTGVCMSPQTQLGPECQSLTGGSAGVYVPTPDPQRQISFAECSIDSGAECRSDGPKRTTRLLIPPWPDAGVALVMSTKGW